jgi:ACS family D-galactonate transporter-like MFS transporter
MASAHAHISCSAGSLLGLHDGFGKAGSGTPDSGKAWRRPMTAVPIENCKRLPPALAVALALLVFSVFINYLDRGNLSIAAPMIKEELGLSASQLGILLSSFFWTYGLFQILSGWLVDRFNVNWVMAGGFFLWSAATSVTGLLHGFVALLVVRTVLGIGESVAYPAYSKILAQHFPDHHRGFSNAVIASGQSCGPAFGMLVGGTLMAHFGWRPFFVGLGLVSLLWLLPWLRWMPRGPGLVPAGQVNWQPGILEVLKQRSAWGSFLGLFCIAYQLYFLIAWLPFYLVRERHFSMYSMARIGGAVFLTQAISSAVCGRVSDRWIAAGATATQVRKPIMAMGLTAGGIFLGASVLAGAGLSVLLLICAGASFGCSLSNTFAITQTLAGPKAAGRWTGLQCAFGNLSGAVAPAVTGLILNRTGHFFWAFALTSGVVFIGALCWLFVVGPLEAVQWGDEEDFPTGGETILKPA